jgi:hypothetical protein
MQRGRPSGADLLGSIHHSCEWPAFSALTYRTSPAMRILELRHKPHEKEIAMVYLQITLKIRADRRAAAGDIYTRYKKPFLTTIEGAKSKDLLLRDDDVQVLHGFDTAPHANAYLTSSLFERDVVAALAPLLDAPPDVRVYTAA